jgi:tyrosine-protein kinase Etk/Wzc
MPEQTMPPPETLATDEDVRQMPAGDTEAKEIDLREFGRALLQGKRVILKFAVVPAVLTAIAVSLMKPTFTAEATFLPPNSMSMGSSPLAGSLAMLSGSSGLPGLRDPGQIYVGILGSHSVADDLIKQLDLTKRYKTSKLSQTETVLKSHTTVLEGKDTIVTVSVDDHDPKLAADLANAYLAALAKLNNRIALTEAAQRRLFFEQQLETQKNELADAEVGLAQSQEKTGLIQPGGQAQLQMTTIAQTQAEISSREIQLRALSESSTEQNPDVIRLRSEIAGLQGQMTKLENSNVQGGAGNIQVPTAKVPELTLIYVRAAREVKYHEALYELLLRQYEAAKLDESRSAPLMQVVDYARVPDTKSGPRRTLLTMLAALLGGFLGTIWVLVRYAMKFSLQESSHDRP